MKIRKIPMPAPLGASVLALALLAGSAVNSEAYPELIPGEPMPFFDFSQGPGLENYGWTVLAGNPEMQYFVVFGDETLTGHTQQPSSDSGTGHIAVNIPQAFGSAFGEDFYYWDSHHATMWVRSPEFKLSPEGDLTFYLIGGGSETTPPAHESEIALDSSPSGFMGVVLRNADTGDFVLSGQRSENGDAGGVFEEIVFTRAELDALDQDAVYTLDFIDSFNGGWGFVNLDSVTIPGTFYLDTGWHDQYADLTLPFLLDFGVAKDTGEDLLRNRQADMSLQADSLRIVPGPGRNVTALASVENYSTGEDFVLETVVTFEAFETPGPVVFGLAVLGGPHVLGESPFTSYGDDFYSLTMTTGATVGDPAILMIREGFHGNVLAQAEWGGTPIFGEGVAFSDDFEDAAASELAWTTGGLNNLWEAGAPGTVSGGPNSAFSGQNVFGTNLDGAFAEYTEAYLRSPVIDLTDASTAVVRYADFHNLDDAFDWYHSATVSVRHAQTDAVLQELSRTKGDTAGWREQEFVLTEASLGHEVILEFYLVTDDWSSVAGWYIDAVEVTKNSPSLPITYTFTAEGAFFQSGRMELNLTVSEENGPEETLFASVEEPLDGNLFGIATSRSAQTFRAPSFDFDTLSFDLQEVNVISRIPTQTIVMGSSTGPLSFTLDHLDPDSLALTAVSSNEQLVPNANIVLAGEGAERTVTVTPAQQEIGSTYITITATGDGVNTSTTFRVDVVSPAPPVISVIPDQLLAVNTITGLLPITLGDPYIDPALLTLTGSSSNQTLAPDMNIVFGGSGADRTVQVSPVAGQTGEAIITITVDNGYLTAETSFLLKVVTNLPVNYEFRSGTLEGWTIVSADLEGQYFAVVPPFLNSPHETAHSGDYFMGMHMPGWQEDWSYTQDSAHDTLLVRSPEFTLSGEGLDLSVWLLAGGADSGSLAGVSVDALPQQSSESGFLGVALRNVTTGTYVLSATKSSNGGSWQEVVIPASALAGLPQGDVYTLDLIDARHGGWGWIQMDTVSIPGILVNPPVVDTPTLTIERIDENTMRLSWPAEAWNFGLQRAFEVNGDYVDPGLAVVTEGDEIAVYDEIVEPKQFYRLIELQ